MTTPSGIFGCEINADGSITAEDFRITRAEAFATHAVEDPDRRRRRTERRPPDYFRI
jgi:hypothetical protein